MSEERNANLLSPVAEGRSYSLGWFYALAIGLLAMLLVASGAAIPLAAGAAEAEPAASSAIADAWRQFLADENPEVLDVRSSGAAWERFLAEREELMRADAYATAFMVMGFEKARLFLEEYTGLEAYLIFNDKAGEYRVWYTEGMEDMLSEEL